MRLDRFKVSDQVTWASDKAAEISGGRYRFGDGPFKVKATIDVDIASTGHPQVLIVDIPGYGTKKDTISGKFFKLIGEPDYEW